MANTTKLNLLGKLSNLNHNKTLISLPFVCKNPKALDELITIRRIKL